ncbi:unnamed protein product [Cylicocyclus nassatus]|uniref:Uncharacterized protein n=1 Tax=Cylicocyclus nassatus TaxID=53992 RepID=A0AA36H204_CYLNA|nr:unnamed protein product [Cylicocyclus nassatus]
MAPHIGIRFQDAKGPDGHPFEQGLSEIKMGQLLLGAALSEEWTNLWSGPKDARKLVKLGPFPRRHGDPLERYHPSIRQLLRPPSPLTANMKAMQQREARPAAPVSPPGRIRKSSAERKEKIKVESTLRRLVGSEEGTSQLELVLSAIRYIRELQSQLENDKENDLPDNLQDLFTQCTVTKAATA